MPSVRILVAQGGGPTAVINQSLAGVVLEARRFGNVERIYGARHGVRGVINEDLVDLTQETSLHLERVAATPASAQGSTHALPSHTKPGPWSEQSPQSAPSTVDCAPPGAGSGASSTAGTAPRTLTSDTRCTARCAAGRRSASTLRTRYKTTCQADAGVHRKDIQSWLRPCVKDRLRVPYLIVLRPAGDRCPLRARRPASNNAARANWCSPRSSRRVAIASRRRVASATSPFSSDFQAFSCI